MNYMAFGTPILDVCSYILMTEVDNIADTILQYVVSVSVNYIKQAIKPL